MKIGIQTWGSTGDIHPFFALAGGLTNAGHQVTVAATSVDYTDFTPLAKKMSFPLNSTYPQYEEGVNLEQSFKEVVERGNPLEQHLWMFKELFEPALEGMLQAAIRLVEENDIVISHPLTYLLLPEKINRVPVILCPYLFEPEYALPQNFSGYDEWNHSPSKSFLNLLFGEKEPTLDITYQYRERLIQLYQLMEEMKSSEDLILVAASPSFCRLEPSWGSRMQVCGFLSLPSSSEKWEMTAELRAFLDSGEPPIYLTFGSMTRLNLEENTRLFIETAQLLGRRVIIQSEWDNLPPIDVTPDIYCVKKIPHREIFPHCSVVVHHGGAGTTQSSAYSGCPSVVVEHAFDQPYWGKSLQRAGIAGNLLHRSSVTKEKLAEQIYTVIKTPSMKERAQKISENMHQENGVSKAVELINLHFQV